jgi:hypothetical protein
MPVSQAVRKVEHEIDHAIASHELFAVQRDRLILAIIDYYRDAIEYVFMRNAHGLQFGVGSEITAGLAVESQLHLGMLQALKWALEFASVGSDCYSPDSHQIADVVHKLGPAYVNFTDALKMANRGRSSIELDELARVITVYEGGDLTGSDAELVTHQHQTLPFRSHRSFVEDGDQLTLQWTAGDFRRLTERLRLIAVDSEKEAIISTFGGLQTPLFQRPVLVEIPDASQPAQQAVLENLTLAGRRLQGPEKWSLSSWFDAPFVKIGPKRMGVSNMIKTLATNGRDDHLLRVAAGADQEQYTRVSGLREDRMIAFCKPILERKGWTVTPHFKLSEPEQEIDIYAERGEGRLVLQLKSTLRPESPWEVLKRNEDVIDGITHTSEVLERLPAGTLGFVLTDGYRGDYQTWKEGLDHEVTTGTVEDIEGLASEPGRATEVLKERAGFGRVLEHKSIQDRESELFGWKLRLIDAPPQ